MPASSIDQEMQPKGVLRDSISALASASGSYIIVSSQGSVSDTALQRRREAMAKAVAALPNGKELHLDFYDRNRIASWVRTHPGLILWVRHALGTTHHGWQPFGAWSHPAATEEEPYLLDTSASVFARPTKEGDEGFAPEAGVQRLREVLHMPASVVRLVGLSGVGKTRFVQALFDERVGKDALDPATALYTNLSHGPDPIPLAMLNHLVALGERAIVIVDNCGPELHKTLADAARAPSSTVSVVTIEYDIREDQTEGTDVFELRAASPQLVVELLKRRFPRASLVDCLTAAELAGGNARIAIALASTVEKSGTLAGLTDEEVFQRLFLQRNPHDKSLQQIAEACSLVYSFDGDDRGEESEMARLGALINASADEVCTGAALLLERDLVQRRSRWRAVLPHALANRLAAAALRKIPNAAIESFAGGSTPERLTISFSRRLGYLHQSPEAQLIATRWFEADTRLGDPWHLNEFEKTIFANLLPVVPETGLAAIERSLPRRESGVLPGTCFYLCALLRSLAYDASLFERCAVLLAHMAAYGEKRLATEAAKVHASLFQLYFSGTHATVAQRVAVALDLLRSSNRSTAALGIAALERLLEGLHFSPALDFAFGARSRDYGFYPNTYGAIRSWFTSVFALVRAALASAHAEEAKRLVARQFRGIWSRGWMHDELTALCQEISGLGFWPDGWVAIKQTRQYDERDRRSPSYAMITALEHSLAPRDLAEEVRGRVLCQGADYLDDDEDAGDEEGAHILDRRVAQGMALGEDVGESPHVLELLGEELVSAGPGNTFYFGRGLARASRIDHIWCTLIDRAKAVPEQSRMANVFGGILNELASVNPSLADRLLDEAVETQPLAPFFPMLQALVPIDKRGAGRLSESLNLGLASAQSFEHLAMGRATRTIEPQDLARLVRQIAAYPNGFNTAVTVLYMRFHGDTEIKREPAPELISVGRELLIEALDRERPRHSGTNSLAGIARVCVKGSDGVATAQAVCTRLYATWCKKGTLNSDAELFKALVAVQPAVCMDVVLGESSINENAATLSALFPAERHPLAAVEPDALVEWCRLQPRPRFVRAAQIVPLAIRKEPTSPLTWSPQAKAILKWTDDLEATLKVLIGRFVPLAWSGSLSDHIATNAALLDDLEPHQKAEAADLLESSRLNLKQEIKKAAAWERRVSRDHDETFE